MPQLRFLYFETLILIFLIPKINTFGTILAYIKFNTIKAINNKN